MANIENSSTIADFILSLIEEKSQMPEGIKEQDFLDMKNAVNTREELEEVLPFFKKACEEYKENVDRSDSNVKTWQETKKFWQSRQASISILTGMILSKLNLSKISAGGVSVSTRQTHSLEVDESVILKPFEQIVSVMQAQLPDYIKINLGVDKSKLTTAIQNDPTIINNNTNAIRWNTKQSVTLK